MKYLRHIEQKIKRNMVAKIVSDESPKLQKKSTLGKDGGSSSVSAPRKSLVKITENEFDKLMETIKYQPTEEFVKRFYNFEPSETEKSKSLIDLEDEKSPEYDG